MKRILLIVAIMAASFTSFAQVGIGTTNPQGALDVVATDTGLILPRVATTGSVTTPVNGMIVYDVSAKCFKGYQDGNWTDCGFMLNAAAASAAVLAQIGLEADAAGLVTSVVTVAQINMISPAITGAVAANQAAYQAYIDANPSLFSSPATAAEVQAMITAVNAAEALPIVTGAAGRIWMDRNLGASQVATSTPDAASYGDYYQWGRAADGHQLKNSAITTTPATTSTPHGYFILSSSAPFDWLATPDDNLWQSVNGVNNPCPYGYRLPTRTELDAERALFSFQDTTGALASPLKLPPAGTRNSSTGSVDYAGSEGYYWSSTVSNSFAYNLNLYSGLAIMSTVRRANGYSVRCIKD